MNELKSNLRSLKVLIEKVEGQLESVTTDVSSKSEEEETVSMEIAKPIISAVWPLIITWLSEKDTEDYKKKHRFNRWLRLIDAKNLRQLLFTRDQKARQKYGRGLTTEDPGGLEEATKKLADAVFFLSKANFAPQDLSGPEFNRQLTLLMDLHSVLGNHIVELKSNPKA